MEGGEMEAASTEGLTGIFHEIDILKQSLSECNKTLGHWDDGAVQQYLDEADLYIKQIPIVCNKCQSIYY